MQGQATNSALRTPRAYLRVNFNVTARRPLVRRIAFGVGVLVLVLLVGARAADPFIRWKAIPSSVVDSEGRVGQVYRAPHGSLAIVVFKKGRKPRERSLLDRIFTPAPEEDSTYLQCIVNPRRLTVGHYFSDEVFMDAYLSRIDGDGWSDAGTLGTVKPQGPDSYVISDLSGYPVLAGYTIKFQIRG